MKSRRNEGRVVSSHSKKSKLRTKSPLTHIESLENRLLLAAQPYTWQNAAIGAGGFLDGVFFSPSQPNVMYARTDIGGLYKSTNGGNNWQQLLNFVGNTPTSSGNGTGLGEFQVLSFAIDPENANNLFALVGGTFVSGNNGNILYSTDGGQTWGISSPSGLNANGNGTARGTGERIAVDPNDSNIIFTGANGSTGLWKSTDSGHTFAKITATGFPAADDVNFVLFDPYGGTAGSPTQTIIVGATAKTSGSNLYISTNGGTSFTQIANTGGPASFYPTRAAFDSTNDGNIYFAYSNQLPPEGTVATNGGVWRFNLTSSTWTKITPALTSGASTSGFVGLGVDAQNPGTLVVTTFDHYNGGDFIFRTTNANAATPTWTQLYGGTNTRNTTLAPYIAAFTDGIGNWAATAAIDPFNTAHIVYGTGQGLWTTLTGNSSTTLTAPNSWYFLDSGIEFTAVLKLASPGSGLPLLSAIGDINGFAHTTLTSSPAAGAIAESISGGGISTMNSIDFAQNNPNIQAIVGGTTNRGAYSLNGGATWTSFASNPGSNGSIAVSADGSTFLSAPSGAALTYSTNDGTTWTKPTSFTSSITSLTQTGGVATAVTSAPNLFAVGQSVTIAGAAPTAYNGTFTITSIVNSTTFTYAVASGTASPATGTITATLVNGTVVSDRVNPNKIYYWTENSSDNAWQLYISTDAGHTFTADGSAIGTGNVTLVANPFVEGDLWISTYIGIYHSTNSGASFTQNSAIGFANVASLSLGAPAPGRTNAAVYMYGILNNFQGVYRSDDSGITWTLLNDVSHQWGGIVDTMAADPNVFGRVYLGLNGSGIVMGNPTTTLPAGWSDADINTPGNPGWATNTTTLSTGTVVNQWTVAGGGAGITSTSDQFNFAYESITGSASLSAKLTSLTNADGAAGTPLAGVMVRGGTTNNDPFAAIVQTSASNLIFEYRTTTGGNINVASLGSVPVGAEFVQISRNGNNFGGSYSTNGTTWTQLGSTIAIAAMPATANFGLAATASYNPQLTSATFTNVITNPGPTVATPAAAATNPVTSTSTALSVLGADNAGEAALTYTWSSSGPATVNFTDATNGTNAAKNITANFTQNGDYTFTATISDAQGLIITSTTSIVHVQQTPTGVIVTPSSITAAPGGTAQFSATATDQFGNAISSPAFIWSITGTEVGNSIDSTGLATLGSTPGTYTITATLGAASNTAQVVSTVAPAVNSFQINDGNAQRSMVNSLTLVFNQSVTLADGAVTLNLFSQTGGPLTPMPISIHTTDSGTTWVVTFTDPSYIGGSVPDGAYSLTVTGAGVTNAQNQTMATDSVNTFSRLYGDFAGTGAVNGTDFTTFALIFGMVVPADQWYVDYDSNGVINGTDFTAFSINFGKAAAQPSVAVARVPAITSNTLPTTTTPPAKNPVLTNKTSNTPPTPPITITHHSRKPTRHGH